jgi:hypothetical protein
MPPRIAQLVIAARKAGIDVPPRPEEFSHHRRRYKHFALLCEVLLDHPGGEEVDEHNARVVASVSRTKTHNVTTDELVALGLKK